ncbi:unnamed protein product [Rhodiola kirilowii]
MALEDFFTLTEMKAGLTTPDRVEELIILMNKEKDKDVKNVEETSRQWSTVARTIACTDNKECLDRFVQLDGLIFINMWLNDIKNCASDIPGSSVEESLVALLLALEKLNIDDEKVTSSGIGMTLRSLIVHNSSVIKDKTMLLLHSWKQHMNTSKVDMDAEEVMCTDNCTKASIKQSESCSIEISHLDVNNESKCTDMLSNSGIPGSMFADEATDVHNAECGNVVGITTTLDHEAVTKGTSDTLCSTNLSIVKDSISITESMVADADPGFTNNGNRSPSNSRKESVLGSLEQNVVVSADVEDKENRITTILDEQLRDDERPSTSRLPKNEAGSDEAKAEESATKASQQDPVMVASERIDIPGPVSSSSQEKILDDPTEQLSKSLPQEVLSGEEFSSRVIKLSGSDSITVQAENVLNRNEPSHVNAVGQEAEINTKAGVLGFDLNEEVLSDDVNPPAVPSQELNKDKVDHYLINQTPMATSVVSASRASAVPGLPAGRLQFEGAHGWKGSAATSAFRPASPRKPVESDNATTSSTGPSSSSSKKRQYVHDFDLNMADDGNGDNTPDSVIAVSSSHPSDESCVEIGPMKSKRVELDLNSLGDGPPSASASAYWSKNGVPLSQQNAYRRSPSPTSSSSSVHPSMWDVDLNKKFSIPTFHYDPQQNSTTFNIMDRKPVESGISIMGTRVDVSREQTFLQTSPFHHANANANLFPPSPQMQSFMYRPAGIPINMVGSPVWHHMMGPAAAQPPYLMNMMAAPPAPNGSCSSFDPNMMYMNNDPRQYVMSSQGQGQGGLLEPHSSAISQPSSSWLTKRKESHSIMDLPEKHKNL